MTSALERPDARESGSAVGVLGHWLGAGGWVGMFRGGVRAGFVFGAWGGFVCVCVCACGVIWRVCSV